MLWCTALGHVCKVKVVNRHGGEIFKYISPMADWITLGILLGISEKYLQQISCNRFSVEEVTLNFLTNAVVNLTWHSVMLCIAWLVLIFLGRKWEIVKTISDLFSDLSFSRNSSQKPTYQCKFINVWLYIQIAGIYYNEATVYVYWLWF